MAKRTRKPPKRGARHPKKANGGDTDLPHVPDPPQFTRFKLMNRSGQPIISAHFAVVDVNGVTVPPSPPPDAFTPFPIANGADREIPITQLDLCFSVDVFTRMQGDASDRQHTFTCKVGGNSVPIGEIEFTVTGKTSTKHKGFDVCTVEAGPLPHGSSGSPYFYPP